MVALAAAPLLNSDIAQTLITLLQQHPYYFYFALVFFACGEGPILSVISGTMIKLGFFSFWPVYAALMLGDLIGDVIWYYIGYYFGRSFVRKFGDRFGVSERKVHRVSKLFHRHKHKILLINKITMGFGFSLATLVTAGIAKIPFWQYITVNALGQFVWTGFLIALGYFVGNAYTYISQAFGVMGDVGLIATFAGIAYAMHQYKKYASQAADSGSSFLGISLGRA